MWYHKIFRQPCSASSGSLLTPIMSKHNCLNASEHLTILTLYHGTGWRLTAPKQHLQPNDSCFNYKIGCAMRKLVFGHMRIAEAQISLRIRAFWSGPSLSTNITAGYHRMLQQRANASMILCTCAGWCQSAHFAHALRHIVAWRGPYNPKGDKNGIVTVTHMLSFLWRPHNAYLASICFDLGEWYNLQILRHCLYLWFRVCSPAANSLLQSREQILSLKRRHLYRRRQNQFWQSSPL